MSRSLVLSLCCHLLSICDQGKVFHVRPSKKQNKKNVCVCARIACVHSCVCSGLNLDVDQIYASCMCLCVCRKFSFQSFKKWKVNWVHIWYIHTLSIRRCLPPLCRLHFDLSGKRRNRGKKKERETGRVAHSSQLTLIKTHVYDAWIFSTWAVPLARLKDLYDNPGHLRTGCAFLRNQQKF